ncbi:hypothetical protein BC833DRAFT_576890 [Globomyces pollinis-pini]|nr:hypothetical protein BC833DRAFT_576890 [Globomyces pollinis-pini]KAJ2991498.1 hypothetical protein HDV02_003757 [Globomyces sp. JEL0801]
MNRPNRNAKIKASKTVTHLYKIYGQGIKKRKSSKSKTIEKKVTKPTLKKERIKQKESDQNDIQIIKNQSNSIENQQDEITDSESDQLSHHSNDTNKSLNQNHDNLTTSLKQPSTKSIDKTQDNDYFDESCLTAKIRKLVSWESHLDSIKTIEFDQITKTILVYVQWKNGRKTFHTTEVAKQKFPVKLCNFYEKYIKFC